MPWRPWTSLRARVGEGERWGSIPGDVVENGLGFRPVPREGLPDRRHARNPTPLTIPGRNRLQRNLARREFAEGLRAYAGRPKKAKFCGIQGEACRVCGKRPARQDRRVCQKTGGGGVGWRRRTSRQDGAGQTRIRCVGARMPCFCHSATPVQRRMIAGAEVSDCTGRRGIMNVLTSKTQMVSLHSCPCRS